MGLRIVSTQEFEVFAVVQEFWSARAVVQKLSQAAPKRSPEWDRFDTARAVFYTAAEALTKKQESGKDEYVCKAKEIKSDG
jgi:hypothetical protein